MPEIFGTLETCRHRGCYPPSTEMEPGRRGEGEGGPCQMGQIGTTPLPPREVAQPPCAHETMAWHIRGCFRRTPVPDAFWNWHGGRSLSCARRRLCSCWNLRYTNPRSTSAPPGHFPRMGHGPVWTNAGALRGIGAVVTGLGLAPVKTCATPIFPT